MDPVRFDRLKRQVETLKREQARAEGSLDELMKKLADDYGCNSIEEAVEGIEAMEEERNELEVKYEQLRSTFEKKWDGLLKG